jgi:elongation factor P
MQKMGFFVNNLMILEGFMATTADFRVGMIIKFNGELHRIDEYIHRTPGNLRAFVQAKLRNLKSGRVSETRYRSGEEVEEVRLEQKGFTYLYHDGASYQFMDKENYEQMPVSDVILGEGAKFLKEGESVQLMMVGLEIVACEIPFNVELKVVDTVPGVRGDTASGATKPAKVESGAMVNVPLFINEGDVIRVDTRTGNYLERVKS